MPIFYKTECKNQELQESVWNRKHPEMSDKTVGLLPTKAGPSLRLSEGVSSGSSLVGGHPPLSAHLDPQLFLLVPGLEKEEGEDEAQRKRCSCPALFSNTLFRFIPLFLWQLGSREAEAGRSPGEEDSIWRPASGTGTSWTRPV